MRFCTALRSHNDFIICTNASRSYTTVTIAWYHSIVKIVLQTHHNIENARNIRPQPTYHVILRSVNIQRCCADASDIQYDTFGRHVHTPWLVILRNVHI